MNPMSRATLVGRLAAVVVAAVLVLAVLGAGHLGLFERAAAREMEDQPPLAAPDSAGLDPELAARFSAAQDAAAAAGRALRVTSGARTAEEQQRLFDEAVAEHGSVEAATRWVLPPERSAHVHGLAIDVGPAEGWEWLADHGAAFGLCRLYANEPWHFEPLVEPGGTCPGLVPDASVASPR